MTRAKIDRNFIKRVDTMHEIQMQLEILEFQQLFFEGVLKSKTNANERRNQLLTALAKYN